jgi:hypothetical protein
MIGGCFLIQHAIGGNGAASRLAIRSIEHGSFVWPRIPALRSQAHRSYAVGRGGL